MIVSAAGVDLRLPCSRQPARYGATHRTTPHLQGLLPLLWANGHDRRRGEVAAEVLRYLLGRNGVVKKAEAKEEPRAAGSSAFCRVESVGVKDLIPGDAPDVYWLYGPLQLHGEENRRIASYGLPENQSGVSVLRRQHGNVGGGGRAIACTGVNTAALENLEYLRISERSPSPEPAISSRLRLRVLHNLGVR
jgi:hypothetical protein